LADTLALFVREEQVHAALLDRLVERYGGRRQARHWTHFLFQKMRHAGGLEFEITVLVTAELVGNAYYRLLERYTTDPVLRQSCAIILADEADHAAFHRDHLRARLSTRLPLEQALFAARLQGLLLAAGWLAWLDHGSCLSALGIARLAFLSEVRVEGVRFLAALAADPPALAGANLASFP
jgi:hypothetical protein